MANTNQPAATADGVALPVETRLESVEELRAALQRARTATTKERLPAGETRPFRPARRPPMALLCILDDGSDEGELVRIRGSRLIIGRGGDVEVVIPHDDMISGRHAEISRQSAGGKHRWFLTDLQSTNGTYVRVASAVLRSGQEIILGCHRYRFDLPLAEAIPATADNSAPASTRAWTAPTVAPVMPVLVELRAAGEGARLPLPADGWLGRDQGQCAVVVQDGLLDPRHARFSRDGQGRWHVEGPGTTNGIWVRITRLPVENVCHFQLGEQRFVLRIL
jgi:pSer/pThr/pTyr-binding forkhead associated (FHA) protein